MKDNRGFSLIVCGLRTFGEAWVVLQITYGLSEHTGLFI
jgi:hypothetical protein